LLKSAQALNKENDEVSEFSKTFSRKSAYKEDEHVYQPKVLQKSQELIAEKMPYRLPMNSSERWAIENQKNKDRFFARE
jgi:hypothetical protein